MKSKKILLLLFSGLIIKILAISLTNFNLFGDEAQYWVWSQNLDIGYYSKPPLIAWFLSVFVFFLGDGFVSLKLFSIFFYIFSTILIYFLSYELFKNK
jgi:4-amino-4-deoxy-L-arabinose transferase-like glycosyltransferase